MSTTSFFYPQRSKNSKSDSSVNSQEKKKSNKFKSVFYNILLVVFLCTIIFGIGYYQGTEHIKNQKIAEIQYSLSSDYELDDWQVFEMALAKTESEYNQYAVGKTNDCGIIQITPIYVKDVNRISEKSYQISDAFDIKKSWEMFSIMQSHYNPEYSIDKAIQLHNPGGKSVNYRNRIYENIIFIKRMEQVRKEVLLNKFYKSDNIILTESNENKSEDSIKIIRSVISSTPVDKLNKK